MRALFALFLLGCGSDAPKCSLVGKWQGGPLNGNFVGQRVFQRFNADGSYEIDLNDAPFYGTWQLDGNRLGIANDTSCQSSPPAQYDLTWYDCDQVVYAIVSDPCSGRAETLNGMQINRTP